MVEKMNRAEYRQYSGFVPSFAQFAQDDNEHAY